LRADRGRIGLAQGGGSVVEVLLAFLRLGVSSFGGPAAHVGYFRAEFVVRRRWVAEAEFADLVGLCQFLPGPASSQTGFAIGLHRAGILGGLAAWAGFTLPSAILMLAFASGAPGLMQTAAGAGVIHGLKLVAVGIVAQAVWGMAHTLCPDRRRAVIAAACAAFVLLVGAPTAQLAAIAGGAIVGLALCRDGSGRSPDLVSDRPEPVSLGMAIACACVFMALLTGLPALHGLGFGALMFSAFYRSGALVFGGGHVVLPLLRDAVVTPGWISPDAFLSGYGAAQALPGPLFSFAAYLGASMKGAWHGAAGAAVALVAIFLPGMLLLMAALPFWRALRASPAAQAALRGINAAVVGLLGAALYNPVWTSAVFKPSDVAAALAGFVLLAAWRAPPLLVVILGAACGLAEAVG
jgi:chromate transporter